MTDAKEPIPEQQNQVNTNIQNLPSPVRPSQPYKLQNPSSVEPPKNHHFVKLIIGIAVFLIIIIAILFFMNQPTGTQEIPTTVIERETVQDFNSLYENGKITDKEVTIKINEDKEIIEKSITQNSWPICNQTSVFSRDECIQIIALQNNDFNICEQILTWDDISSHQYEYENCRYLIALSIGTSDICNELLNATEPQFGTEACIFQYIVNKENTTSCGFADNNVTDLNNAKCVNLIAEREMDADLCAEIGNSTDSYYTYYFCIKNVALQTGNISICNTIDFDTGPNSRFECISDIAVSYNRPELCEQLPDYPVLNNKQDCLAGVEENQVIAGV